MKIKNIKKIGFIGTGNMGKAFIKGLIYSKTIKPENIFICNRSKVKEEKIQKNLKVISVKNNEELIEKSDIVIIAVKPQDFFETLEPLSSTFTKEQIIISIAAGINIQSIKKVLPNHRIVRLMPSTSIHLREGVLGYCTECNDEALNVTIEDIFSPLGYLVKFDEDEKFEALIITCASGPGFIYEIMQYWQEWLEERGISKTIARKMTVETFLGACKLAKHSKDMPLEELQSKVISKKGVTHAGLNSMRELELERIIRYSFEKAALKNQELGKNYK